MPHEFERVSFQIDHVIAQQHSGAIISENLALACYACNRHKGPNIAGFDLPTQQTIRLFHPRRDSWPEHFEWDAAELIGLTPVGLVTVHVLAINLYYRVALRRAVMQEGRF